jgi:O-succinylbenzoate synthase
MIHFSSPWKLLCASIASRAQSRNETLLEMTRAYWDQHIDVPELAPDSFCLQGFLSGEGDSLLALLHQKLAVGIRSFKLKVSRHSIEEDVRRVQWVSQHLPEGAGLRLDANRGWSIDEALKFSELVQGLPIEYIEEPLKGYALLPKFCVQSGMQVALDETLLKKQDWAKYYGLSALVVKPEWMSVGQVWFCLKQSKRYALPISWSASFESEAYLDHLGIMAGIFSPDFPSGLDYGDYWTISEGRVGI